MSFAAYHRQCVAHYLTTNKLTSLGAINGNILEDITQRAFDSYEAQTKAKKKRGDATPEEIAIYELYPRKVARADALGAIRGALAKVSAETLLERVRHYGLCVGRWPKNYRFKEGADLCPYPATWFNKERWTDSEKEWMPAGMFQRVDDPQEDTGRSRDHSRQALLEPDGWKEEFPDAYIKVWKDIPDDSKKVICDHMNKVRA